MDPKTRNRVSRIVRERTPELDAAGFIVSSIYEAPESGRLRVCYTESTGIPNFLVDAIAQVTSRDVDFVHERTVAIARFESADRTEPRRALVSIEDLQAERDRES